MIDYSSYKTNVYVEPDYSLSFDFSIVTDAKQQSILTISRNDITMHKILKNENIPDNFFISVSHALDESILDLFHITDETIPSQILHLLQNYSL